MALTGAGHDLRMVVWVRVVERDMREEAERARSLGWSALEDVGNHVDVVERADDIADDLIRIVG